MSDRLNEDDSLTKPKQKKPRSDAQQEATKKMLSAAEDKRMKLQAIKDKLNNAPPIQSDETSSEDEPPPKPLKPLKPPKEAKPPKEVKPPKEPRIVYQTDSETEEEVVIVKKKKKPKKKTIIYEEESESEEEVTQKKSRDTKTQQNKASFKVTPSEAKPAKPAPLYYFAD
jgi:hypothetical protein